MGSAKIMARDLVRTRKYIQKFYQVPHLFLFCCALSSPVIWVSIPPPAFPLATTLATTLTSPPPLLFAAIYHAQMRTQLQGVSLRIQTMQSNQAMTEAMVGVTRAMRVMNGQINVPQLQRIMMEFERQSEMMDMKVGWVGWVGWFVLRSVTFDLF